MDKLSQPFSRDTNNINIGLSFFKGGVVQRQHWNIQLTESSKTNIYKYTL